MTPEYLSAIAGILLSLFASYLPGFSTWYDPLSANAKRLIMLVLLACVAVGSIGIACAGWGGFVDPVVACDESGFAAIIKAFVAAIIANQTVYALSPRKE